MVPVQSMLASDEYITYCMNLQTTNVYPHL